MVRPAMDAGLKESAVDDELAAAFEQVEQAQLATRSIENIGLLDSHPGHPAAFGGKLIACARHGLLLHQHLLSLSLPFLWRYDRRHCHGGSALGIGGHRHG